MKAMTFPEERLGGWKRVVKAHLLKRLVEAAVGDALGAS